MTISLLGLVMLQLYWITHDYALKEQQFEVQVRQAMNHIVEQVEKNENLRLVANHIMTSGDSVLIEGGLNDSLLNVLASFSDPALTRNPLETDSADGFLRRISERLSGFNRSDNPVRADQEENFVRVDSALDIRIEKDITRKEVIAFRMDDDGDFSLNDTAGSSTAQRVRSRLRRLNTMIQKISFQIIAPGTPLFNRISRESLDSIIRFELRANGWSAYNCRYGVSDGDSGKWLYLSTDADTLSLCTAGYRLPLFPSDVFRRNETLHLHFAGKFNFLMKSIWPMLLFSLLFTGVIIAGFYQTVDLIRRQKKLAEIKNDFINNMTHEFKTPIATIAIANASIRDERVIHSPEKINFYADIIRDENQRMLKQVETVLQMAQLDKGELLLELSPVDLNDLVEAAMSGMKLTVMERGGTIEVVALSDTCIVMGDPDHLLNVITNLLDNANKYSPGPPEISVVLKREGEEAILTVSDKGIGMTKDVQQKIFENFFRAERGNRHDVKGFGLGLSYVKAIINQHKGMVSVSSEPGQGSIFTLRLPLIINKDHETSIDFTGGR